MTIPYLEYKLLGVGTRSTCSEYLLQSMIGIGKNGIGIDKIGIVWLVVLKMCNIFWCYILTVPPDQPQIEGSSNGSIVKVPYQQESLSMTCLSTNGKPASEIKWFVNFYYVTVLSNYLGRSFMH